MNTKKSIILAGIFVIAFVLNAVWEHAHAPLYVPFSMGEPLTSFVLFRAALADAAMITALALPPVVFPMRHTQSYRIIIAGIVLGIGIEWYALATGMWAYNTLMPIVPFVGTGLTPTIQLGLLGYIALFTSKRIAARFPSDRF